MSDASGGTRDDGRIKAKQKTAKRSDESAVKDIPIDWQRDPLQSVEQNDRNGANT
jgi:hypothetical protein